MKVKLFFNNIEVEADISEKDYERVMASLKKTGYEKVTKENPTYYFDNGGGYVGESLDPYPETDGNNAYKAANYYTDKTVAENNIRADKLMRQLRRFAVEHRKEQLDWTFGDQSKYYIYYDYGDGVVRVSENHFFKDLGVVYFDSKETAWETATAFADEIVWYFTEHKDSL